MATACNGKVNCGCQHSLPIWTHRPAIIMHFIFYEVRHWWHHNSHAKLWTGVCNEKSRPTGSIKRTCEITHMHICLCHYSHYAKWPSWGTGAFRAACVSYITRKNTREVAFTIWEACLCSMLHIIILVGKMVQVTFSKLLNQSPL